MRATRRFNTLKVPRKLQAALPYASKPKMQRPQLSTTYMSKRAVILEPEEKKAISLLQQIQAVNKAKLGKRKERKIEKKVERKKKIDKQDEGRKEREKIDKAIHFKQEAGKAESAKRKRGAK